MRFKYISVGTADPRQPLIVPLIRTVWSIYLLLTPDRVGVITRFFWNPNRQEWV